MTEASPVVACKPFRRPALQDDLRRARASVGQCRRMVRECPRRIRDPETNEDRRHFPVGHAPGCAVRMSSRLFFKEDRPDHRRAAGRLVQDRRTWAGLDGKTAFFSSRDRVTRFSKIAGRDGFPHSPSSRKLSRRSNLHPGTEKVQPSRLLVCRMRSGARVFVVSHRGRSSRPSCPAAGPRMGLPNLWISQGVKLGAGHSDASPRASSFCAPAQEASANRWKRPVTP